MIELAIIAAAAVVLARSLNTREAQAQQPLAPRRWSAQLAAASTYADRLFAEKKWLAAEKAYVKVLKFDHKNLTAYSHLGIIYSTQKNLPDAIECFEIAVRLKPAATTYQNLALAYHENHNYMKAIAAFEKAIMFEPSANRYIGLSRAYKKISHTDQMLAALEHAAQLDPSPRLLELLAATYLETGRPDDAAATTARRAALAVPSALAQSRRPADS